MKLQTALFAAALMAAGTATAHAAAPENETKSWIVGTRPGAETARTIRSRPIHRFQFVDAYAVQMTEQEAAELRRSGEVRYVEPDYPRYLYRERIVKGPRRIDSVDVVGSSTSARGATQRDPYGIDLVRARLLWPYTRGAGIKVGVVDTGIDYNHPDLRKKLGPRSRLVTRPRGYDFINNDHDPIDDHGHGTHVAGTIAAANNQIGVVGVAPEIELYALKVLAPDAEGNAVGSASAIVKAIDWAIANRLKILNLSLGSEDPSTAEKEAFARAWNAGILSIAAAGNGYGELQRDVIGFPAAYPNVVAVGAIDSTEAIANFSQRGTELAVVAPGVGVLSTLPTGTGVIGDLSVDGDFLAEVEAPLGSPLGRAAGRFVACGLGKLGEFPASVAGNIAVIKRGEITFNEKARNAKAAGASAVVIYNHENSALNWTLIRTDATTGQPIADEFPVTVAISKTDGEALVAKPAATIDLAVSRYDYGTLQGTSMATPHVTGVVALIWSLEPDATAPEVRNAVVTGARDLGAPGWDTVFGHGVVDAFGSARILAPQRIDSTP